jgi:hypothetical protein
VNDFLRGRLLAAAIALLITFAATTAAAQPSGDSAPLPGEAALVRAEALMADMLERVRALRATTDREQRRALLADLIQELEALDALERGDRMCPLCPLLVAELADAVNRNVSDVNHYFLASYPQVPLPATCGSASANRGDAGCGDASLAVPARRIH